MFLFFINKIKPEGGKKVHSTVPELILCVFVLLFNCRTTESPTISVAAFNKCYSHSELNESGRLTISGNGWLSLDFLPRTCEPLTSQPAGWP